MTAIAQATGAAGAAPRKIGPVLAAGLVAGNIIGSGVFLLPATLGAIGSVSLVGWIAATFGAFLFAGAFACLGRLSDTLDGMVGYAHQGLGRLAGFTVAVFYWMSAWVGTVAISVAAAGYLAVFIPGLSGPPRLAVASIAVIWTFTLINIFGPRAAARFSGASLAAGLVPIAAVGLLGWTRFDPHIFAASWNVSGHSPFDAFRATLIPAFWAYLGLESAAVVNAVVREPRRNVGRATLAGVAIAAVVYIAASAAMMGLAPPRELAASTAPFALVATRLFGPWTGGVIAACALIKTCGALCGAILITSESGRAGIDVYFLPGRATPDRSGPRTPILLAMAALMTGAVAVSVSPTLGRQYGALINVATLWSLIAYALCALALLPLAAGFAGAGARRGAWALAGAGTLFMLWLASGADRISLILTAVVAVAVGVVWAAVARRRSEG